ncbi:MAG: AmmeMemoRadiSam system radical SAM enzyme, partial [Candidatus Binatia bacterium]
KTLLRAAALGRRAGLRYVYAGNLPGHVAGYEHTYCPACGAAVVERSGYRIRGVHLNDGCCATCGTPIPGRWGSGHKRQRFGVWTPRPVALS